MFSVVVRARGMEAAARERNFEVHSEFFLLHGEDISYN